MKNTGGDFQFPAPMDVEPPGYLAAQISHKKPEQAYPHVVRAGETDLPERGDVARPVSDIPGQLSGSETSMAGNMTFPQHNVYVYGNSLTSSADIWNVPGPNTSAPSIYMASVSQPFVSDNPLPSVRGANLAFPLAARAYQFMVPRAELLLASSRYAEEYLDLVAALYCLFQKWPCNNMEEFAEQTRRHQANAATSTPSRPGGAALPS
ncbi:conserved hypothetical protein [Neospora caninum Liverpool]|uniref:Uncharacterized protein n=1 Tax=Neospora caninum (strain Liverpool) TaxID=572307 RepID=F0VDA0_NEOCL|nr:conserved hypothetical protein [Neospora caninum Liverpool]CBZ51615.1 conserved hypothetical protein [Neospora caninum Liverpool]CEL65567.1 TPA: hypothetical protein BN1204_014090 [Neospora caninum Liverpool]|eukprot:XP_003881648.1 conserved hypothetical protein [Neospora caninum Liverpool]